MSIRTWRVQQRTWSQWRTALTRIIDLYILAHRLGFNELMDLVIEILGRSYIEGRMMPSAKDIDKAYQYTKAGCGLRRFMAKAFMWGKWKTRDGEVGSEEENLSNGEMLHLLAKHRDLSLDILMMERGNFFNGGWTGPMNQFEERICAFHEHGDRGAEECYCAGKYFSEDKNMGGGDRPARGETGEPNLRKDGERILPESGRKDGNQNDKILQQKEKPEVEQENAQHPWPRELAKAADNATSIVDLTNERTAPKNTPIGDPENAEQPLWETGKQILETLMQSKRKHELEPKEKAAKDQVSSVWGPDDSDSDDLPTDRKSCSFSGTREWHISIGEHEETQQILKAANEGRKETEEENSDDEPIIRKLSSRRGSKVGRALSPESGLDDSMDYATGGSKQIPSKSGNIESGNDDGGEEDEDIDSLEDFIDDDSEVIEADNETELAETNYQEDSKTSPAKGSDADDDSDDIRARQPRRFQEKRRRHLADASGDDEDSDEIPIRNLRKRLRERTPWERRLRARPLASRTCGCWWGKQPHYCGDAFKKIMSEIGPESETETESESEGESEDEGEEGNGETRSEHGNAEDSTTGAGNPQIVQDGNAKQIKQHESEKHTRDAQ
jgi:hypothetical protein